MSEFFRRLFFVRKCLGCRTLLPETAEGVFCKECYGEYEGLKHKHCQICGKPHVECRCMPPKLYKDVTLSFHLIPYVGEVAHDMIYTMKSKRLFTVERYIAKELAMLLSHADFPLEDLDLAYVPRSFKGIMNHGFDHAQVLAEALSKQISVPVVSLFFHKRKTMLQKTLSSFERTVNAKKSYTLRRRLPKKRSHRLLIVDDVVTTGSTMAKLASLAKEIGYTEINVLCIARTMRRKVDQ